MWHRGRGYVLGVVLIRTHGFAAPTDEAGGVDVG
jgi:hypothetical protein